MRSSLRRWGGSAVVLAATALKWAFVFGKLFAVFVSFALYSYLFGSWVFGLGLVLLILVHELGHYFEARRQGLSPTLPQFVPFFGAYVRIKQAHLEPWGSALISLAGPFVGSIGAAIAWGASTFGDAQLLVGLANFGFLLNAFNLLPIGFLDGGGVWRAISQARHGWIRYENGVPVEPVGPDRERANTMLFLYVLLAAAIVVGLMATKQNGAL